MRNMHLFFKIKKIIGESTIKSNQSIFKLKVREGIFNFLNDTDIYCI